MIERRTDASRLAVGLGLALGLLMIPPSSVRGQGHTPDPYNIVGDYNSQYEPFMYATEPTNAGVFPNQSRLLERQGNRAANRFQSYVNEMDGAEGEVAPSGGSRRGGFGTPYYRAYRQFDQGFQRLYRPNKEVDTQYYQEQSVRNDKYFEAISEKDRRKRAQLLREYNMENLRAARGLSTARNAPERDRFSPTNRRTAPLDTPEEEPAPPTMTRRPAAPLPSSSGRRPSGAPSVAPSLNRPRTGSTLGRDLTRPLPRAGLPPSTFGRAPVPSSLDRSASDILNRSESLDRTRRPTAPRLLAPRPTAPPPN